MGDSPKHKSRWDFEYEKGLWNYLNSQEENSRYWVLIGYMDALRQDGEFLEIGCGDGVLYNKFKRLGYNRYVGVDISEVAISRLLQHNDRCTYFEQGDCNSYVPTGLFDLIVFNESLYYLHNFEEQLLRFCQYLKPSGHIVASIYTDSRRTRFYIRQSKRVLEVLRETRTTNGIHTWLCTAFKPPQSKSQS